MAVVERKLHDLKELWFTYLVCQKNEFFTWRKTDTREEAKTAAANENIKIELCIRLSILRLFHVDHVVQNRLTALSLAWHEWFSGKGKE